MAIETWTSQELTNAGFDVHLPEGLKIENIENIIDSRLEKAGFETWTAYQLNEGNTAIRLIQFGGPK